MEGISTTPIATYTTISTSGSPSFIGQTVTFNARVNWGGIATVPDGELVTFYDGSSVLGTGTTANGVAVYSTSTLSVKPHTIRATYGGDPHFRPSSATVKQVVSLFTTTTTLGSSPNPSHYEQAVNLRAQVKTLGSSTPTGTVTFKSGATSLGVVALDSSGRCSLNTIKIPLGASSLTAIYNGDSLNGKSTSTAITQTVNQATLRMTLTSSLNPSKAGKSVKFTATLTSNGGLPSGTANAVIFASDGTTLGSAIIYGGKATLTTAALPIGSHVVTATYAGSSQYSSASTSLTQVVQ